jgi:hypothetical protein
MILHRLNAYYDHRAELEEHYLETGRLFPVVVKGDPHKVFKQVKRALSDAGIAPNRCACRTDPSVRCPAPVPSERLELGHHDGASMLPVRAQGLQRTAVIAHR